MVFSPSRRAAVMSCIFFSLAKLEYGHENEMYNVGLNLKEVECL